MDAVQRIRREIEALRTQLERSKTIMRVSEASRDLRDYVLNENSNDPLLPGWQGENLWVRTSMDTCCVVL